MNAALREAGEEAGIDGDDVRVAGMWRDDHGGWEYVTVLATAGTDIKVQANAESIELRWVPAAEVDELDLHPGFTRSWPEISAMLP